MPDRSHKQDIPVAQTDNTYCDGCSDADNCRKAWSAPRRGPFSAAGLSLGSALVFLLPLVTAIIAAAVYHYLKAPSEKFSLGQVLAAAAGLLIGACLARLLLPSIRKHFHESQSPQNHHRN